jgi:hypothetical protein
LNEPFLHQKQLKKNFIFLQESIDTSRLIAIFPANSHGVGLQALSWMSTKPYIASSELSPGGLQVSST